MQIIRIRWHMALCGALSTSALISCSSDPQALRIGATHSDAESAVRTHSQALTLAIYASPSGSGSTCSWAAPCSLTSARDKVRTLNANMTSDISVKLLSGVYRLNSPLTLTEDATTHDSGNHGFNVIYEAAPGATSRPILSAGTPVTGFSLFDAPRNIYRANVGTSLRSRQLFVKGRRATRAGTDAPASYSLAPSGWVTSDTTIRTARNLSSVELVSRNTWKEHRCPVASATAGAFRHLVARSTGSSFAFETEWLPSPKAATLVGDFDGADAANAPHPSDLLFTYSDTRSIWHNDVALSTGSAFTTSAHPEDVNWSKDGAGTHYYIGNFDGDARGTSDLLLTSMQNGTWRNDVYLSTGNHFTSTGSWSGDGAGTSYYVGDFTGDGKSDLLLTLMMNGAWHNLVYRSDGTKFVYDGDWSADGAGTHYYVGDFNGDGKSDLLLTLMMNGAWHNLVYRSDGTKFVYDGDWSADGAGTSYFIGDFTGDGKSDVLLAFSMSGGWHNLVYRSDGTRFVYAGDWSPDGAGTAYLLGDFDGDRKTDILFRMTDPNLTSVALQEPCFSDVQTYVGMKGASRIENVYEQLDTPGEWYLDSTEGYLYYSPRSGENLATDQVVLATGNALVVGNGVQNVQFKGLTFAHATWLDPSTASGYPEAQAGWHYNNSLIVRTPAAVAFSASKNLRFERNVFAHLGAAGLSLDTGSQNSTVIGNVFSDISSSAIQLGDIGDPAVTDPTKKTLGNAIQDNYITQAANEYRGAVGIFVGYSDSTSIVHNELESLPYTGISMGWGWGTLSYAQNNTIASNYIHDVVEVLQDGGAIYTLSRQLGSQLTSNYLLRVGTAPGAPTSGPPVEAIYHDNSSEGFVDTNNVVASARYWTIMNYGTDTVHMAKNVSLTGNYVEFDDVLCGMGVHLHSAANPALCQDPSGAQQTCSLQWCNNPALQEVVSGNVFKNNGPWPSAAQSIMAASGLEASYASIKQAACGDATCNGSETGASCPQDCQ